VLTTISELLTEFPELSPLVKAAESWDDFPTDTDAQVIFSFALANHMEKSAQIYDIPEHVKRAVAVGKIRNPEITRIVDGIAQKQLPKMQARSNEALTKEASVPSIVAEEFYMEKSAAELRDIADTYGHQFHTPELAIKAGQKGFSKEAAIESLQSRCAASGDKRYEQLVDMLEKTAGDLSTERCATLGAAMDILDRETGLASYGFNFAKEAAQRRSELPVKLDKKTASIEELLQKHQHLENIVGDKLPKDPHELKAVMETLPLDLKRLVERHVL